MRCLIKVVGGLGAAALLLIATPASAHRNGHESRTVAECARLPTPERGHCEECVQRPQPHHFHPDYPAGKRCRPNNGKP
ncbi:MAG TPA: hypothetical protein VII38_15225 [Polyangia bacterium]|jgi:hypothetical protein